MIGRGSAARAMPRFLKGTMMGLTVDKIILVILGVIAGWFGYELFGTTQEDTGAPPDVVAMLSAEEVATSTAELVADGSMGTRIPLIPRLRHSGTAQRTVPAWELNTLWPGVC